MPSETADRRRSTTVNNHHVEPEHLPCPRCDSTNTKFCYYNNYNFSQPRHFCKSCRRYWTQGGTLRDIPVGGSSRKNAKRPRVSNATATSSGLEYRSILPSSSGMVALGGTAAAAGQCGSFTSLLSSTQGIFLPEVCGFDQDVSFGVGRTIWPFTGVGGGVVGGHSGGASGGSTWQLEHGVGDGGGDCFVLPDLAISTPANAMK